MIEDQNTFAQTAVPLLTEGEKLNQLPPQPIEPAKFRLGLFRWVGAGLVLFILLAVMWFLLHAGFAIPESSVAVIVTSSHAVAMLPASVQANEPAIWKQALEGNSSWPVVLGVFREGDSWHAFAIAPRWRVSGVGEAWQETHGLFTLVADAKPSSTKIFYYSSAIGWRLRHPLSSLIALVDLHALWPADAESAFSPFWVYGTAPQFATSLSYREPVQSLETGDISVSLPAGGQAQPLVRAFLDRLSIGDRSVFDLLPSANRVRFRLDPGGAITGWALQTPEPLTEQEKQQVLASLHLINHRPIQLLDGTVVSEQRLATIGTQNAFLIPTGSSTTPLLFDKNTVSFGSTTATGPVLACHPNALPVAYFSAGTMTTLIHSFGFFDVSSTAFELAEDGGELVACFQ